MTTNLKQKLSLCKQISFFAYIMLFDRLTRMAKKSATNKLSLNSRFLLLFLNVLTI